MASALLALVALFGACVSEIYIRKNQANQRRSVRGHTAGCFFLIFGAIFSNGLSSFFFWALAAIFVLLHLNDYRRW